MFFFALVLYLSIKKSSLIDSFLQASAKIVSHVREIQLGQDAIRLKRGK